MKEVAAARLDPVAAADFVRGRQHELLVRGLLGQTYDGTAFGGA